MDELLLNSLLKRTTYNEILNDFVATDLLSPGYLILAGAGKGEGAIVTRNRTGSYIVLTLIVVRLWLPVTASFRPNVRPD